MQITTFEVAENLKQFYGIEEKRTIDLVSRHEAASVLFNALNLSWNLGRKGRKIVRLGYQIVPLPRDVPLPRFDGNVCEKMFD